MGWGQSLRSNLTHYPRTGSFVPDRRSPLVTANGDCARHVSVVPRGFLAQGQSGNPFDQRRIKPSPLSRCGRAVSLPLASVRFDRPS
jgi:hypothetical protein